MHFSAVVIALAGATTVLASPMPGKSMLVDRQAVDVCTGTSNSAVCCATDVLGVADLDCAPPPTAPTSVDDFTDICAAIGQRARCCLLPILEQGLICSAPGK